MKELILPASVEQLDTALAFVSGLLLHCPMEVKLQIEIAVEEIFVNIATYAYAPGTGTVTLLCQLNTAPAGITVQLADSGKPYNPLTKEDPDITLSAEERSIGGLGIYMVKESMDAVSYEYKDGQNRFSLTKYFTPLS